ASGTEHREFLSLEPSPEAMNAWVQTLRTRFHGQPVAVCLELNTGPIVSALRHDDCLVLLPVHPLTVAKYREALTPEPGARRPHRCCTPGRAPPQTPRQAHPTQPPQPDDARLGATRRTSPASGRRQSASPQPLDPCPETLLSPRPAVVSGQRYRDLLRLPEPLADAQSGTTRTSHHAGELLPDPPRALGRRDHHPYRGHQEGCGIDRGCRRYHPQRPARASARGPTPRHLAGHCRLRQRHRTTCPGASRLRLV